MLEFWCEKVEIKTLRLIALDGASAGLDRSHCDVALVAYADSGKVIASASFSGVPVGQFIPGKKYLIQGPEAPDVSSKSP
jgi:hypothetical protein